MTDAGLVHLQDMTDLRRLFLGQMKLRGDGLKNLAGMDQLVNLALFNCRATNAALAHLPSLPALTAFSLHNSRGFTDAALANLARLENLEQLTLTDTPLRGPGLRFLAPLSRLRRLDLGGGSNSRLTDDGLAHMPPLPGVESLRLSYTGVTDAGLLHLRVLAGLHDLDLDHTEVTDAGVPHLAALPALEFVNLNHTQVTPEGVRALLAARPGIEVSARGNEDSPPEQEQLQLIPRPESRTAAPVAQSWDRIERWFREHLPEALATLRPPARPADLDRLEAQIGRPLPADFRESYLIHDGQNPDLDRRGYGVIFGMELRSLADTEGVLWLYEYRVEHEWSEPGDWGEDWTFYPPGAIREAWSGPGWVPVFWDCGRNFLGIDLDPGPSGVVGQVIPFGGDDEERPVLALSWAHFLEDIADELEAGHASVGMPEFGPPFRLRGAASNYFANCYLMWARAKLPRDFQSPGGSGLENDEWASAEDPETLLDVLRRSAASPRKHRLFACACCRRVWHLIPEGLHRSAVEIAERFADVLAGQEELESVRDAVRRRPQARGAAQEAAGRAAWSAVGWESLRQGYGARGSAAHAEEAAALAAGRRRADSARQAERAAQCALLRDVFGDFFDPVVDGSKWQSSIVVNMARTIYEDRAFNLLPILADALEEAGCVNSRVLNHCRNSAIHTRGCWVVDLLLGKV